MGIKLQKKKVNEGNKWFSKTVDKLQNTTVISELQIKVIITETILYSLTHVISFTQFIKIIYQLEERPEITVLPELAKMINELLFLERYCRQPSIHREEIVNTLNNVVDEIIKEY